MSKHSNQPKKAQLSKSDMDFYRMSVLFFLLCGALFLILKVSTTLTERHASGLNMGYELYKLFRSPAYIVVAGALLAASLVWFIYNRAKHISEQMRAFSSVNALALMLYVTGFSLYFGYRPIGDAASCTFALTATVALGLLYYISKFYHRDFLFFSLANAVFGLLLYRLWALYTVAGLVFKVLLVIAFAALGVAAVPYLKKHMLRPHTAQKKQNAPLVFPYFISLVLWTFCMFIKLPDIPSEPLIHSDGMLTLLLAQYIVFAIVYTIKLIRE